jgi:hypothetical protein
VVSTTLLLQCIQINTIEEEVNLRPTVSRPVRLGVRPPSGTRDQFFFLLEISFRQLRVLLFCSALSDENHENENVRFIGQGEAPHRKYKRLKLGGGHVYDCSSV